MQRLNIFPARHHTRIRWAALAIAVGLILFSAVAAADEFGFEAEAPVTARDMPEVASEDGISGWVEPGLGLVEASDAGFGQYNALHSDGVYGVLHFDLWHREDGRSGDTRYLQIEGRGFGTGTGDLSAETGDQGNYKIRFGVRQIERLDRDDALTVFRGSSNRLVLPNGYNGPADAADRSFYRDVDFGVKREEFSLYAEKVLNSRWMLISDARYENKRGEKPTAVGQGFRGTAIGIQSIDYGHTQLNLRLRHTDSRRQLEFGYYFSHFDNDDRALNFENPLYAPRTGEPASAGSQQLALSPENFFHQLSLTGGFALSDTTRLTGHAAFGRATQDEKFLPYSTALFYDFDGDSNPDATAPAYPRDSLEGKVDQTNLKLALFSRMSSKLNTELRYRYEHRDNKTPVGTYRHLHYDGEADEEWGNRVNSRERHTTALEGKWRLPKRMRLKAGYEHQRTFRDTRLLEPHAHHDDDTGDTDVTSSVTSRNHVTREDRIWSQLRFPASRSLTAKVKVSGSKRNTGSSQAFDEHINEHDAVAPTYLLDRHRVAVETSANWQARSDLLVSASWLAARERFRNTRFGPNRVSSSAGNFDVSFSPRPDFSANLFFGVDSADFSQNSRGTGGDRGATTAVSDRWSVKVEDLSYHAGLGVDWRPEHQRYDMALDYSVIDAANAVSSKHEADGKGHLPDSEVRIHRVSLRTNVPLRKQLTLTTGYRFQRYDTNNWSWNSEDYSVLGFGWDNPNSSAHALMMGLRFQF